MSADPSQTHEIRFEPSGRRIRVAAGSTLLEATRDAELPIASACGADALCARCGLEIIAGGESLPEETAHEVRVKERNRIDPSLRLACQATIRADLVVRAPYW